MKIDDVYYSEKLDALVIVRENLLDEETKEPCILVEWHWQDMLDARQFFGTDVDLFFLGKFVYIGAFE